MIPGGDGEFPFRWLSAQLARIDEVTDIRRVAPARALVIRIEAAIIANHIDTGLVDMADGLAFFADRLAEFEAYARAMPSVPGPGAKGKAKAEAEARPS